MDIILTNDTKIQEISKIDYSVHTINQLKKEHGALRQQSKAPT